MSRIFMLVFATLLLAGTQGLAEQKHFREKIKKKGAISYGELQEQLAETDSVYTKVMGTVDEVC